MHFFPAVQKARAVAMMSLPNILTLSRIVALPLLAFLLWWPDWQAGYALAFVLYCLMGITDYFDGYLARSSGAVSRLGIFLDPIADKIMVLVVIVVLTAQGFLRGPYVGDMHVIAGLIILVREIAVSGLREFLGGLGAALPREEWIHLTGLTFLWGAAILTLVTGWDYLRVGLKHMD